MTTVQEPKNTPRDLAAQKPAAAGPLSRLKAVILLAGSVRPGRLSTAIGRSILDLPVENGRNLLDLWVSHAASLAQAARVNELTVRVLVDQSSPLPSAQAAGPVKIAIERDPFDFRGTAGVLHDLVKAYDDDDLVLVAAAAQILLEPLPDLVAALAAKSDQVSLIAHDNGIPSSLTLMRCACLRQIAPIGFVDLKEQALPAIAARHLVAVVRRPEATGLPVRTLFDYIVALRHYHQGRAAIAETPGTPGNPGAPGSPGASAPAGPAADWMPTFSIVEEGAQVAADARVHDSVVLRGGSLGRGAVAVQSIICPGGGIAPARTAMNQVISSPNWRE